VTYLIDGQLHFSELVAIVIGAGRNLAPHQEASASGGSRSITDVYSNDDLDMTTRAQKVFAGKLLQVLVGNCNFNHDSGET
jgi:hypothetical protein